MTFLVAFFGNLIRAISGALKLVWAGAGLSWKHWLLFAVAGGDGVGVGDGHGSVDKVTNPLDAPMYWTL